MSIAVKNVSLNDPKAIQVLVQVDSGLSISVTLPRGERPIEEWTIGELGEAARLEAAKRLPAN